MTEDEAKTKYCVHLVTVNDAPKCDGSMCMAWRWEWRRDHGHQFTTRTEHGYCGLAGKPEGMSC